MKAEVLSVFKIQGNLTGKHEVNGFGILDFDKIDLEEATALHKAGCEVFVKLTKEDKAEAKK